MILVRLLILVLSFFPVASFLNVGLTRVAEWRHAFNQGGLTSVLVLIFLMCVTEIILAVTLFPFEIPQSTTLMAVVVAAISHKLLRPTLDPVYTKKDDMTGKVVIITGATSGLGETCALRFAEMGATVVITARQEDKAKAVVEDIQKKTGSKTVSYLLSDFMDLNSVKVMAETILQKYPRIDVLVNNAGMVPRRGTTKQGFETGFGVMHLAHFLLSRMLRQRIMESKGRIITISSHGHTYAKRSFFEEFHGKKIVNGMPSYGRAKLLNLWFTTEFAKRYPEIPAFTFHPGSVYTPIWVHAYPFKTGAKLFKALFDFWGQMFMRDTEAGIADIIFCAASDDALKYSGKYLLCMRPSKTSSLAQDQKLASEMWTKSEEFLKDYLLGY